MSNDNGAEEIVQEVSAEAQEDTASSAGVGESGAAQDKQPADNVTPLNPPKIDVTPETKQVAQAFRILADKIEVGELSNMDFALVIPKLTNGDMPMLLLGNPVPNVMLEGLLHRMLTKMALQS